MALPVPFNVPRDVGSPSKGVLLSMELATDPGRDPL